MDPARRLRRLRRASPGRRWAIPAVVATVILVGSLVPPPPGGPGGTSWTALDGLLHALAYAALALAVATARTGPGSGDHGRVRRAIDAVAVAVAYGAAIELLQAPIPWRRFAVDDLLANAIGAALAAAWTVAAPHVRRALDRGSD